MKRIKEDHARILISMIVKALIELSRLNVVHRDIKLANMLIHFPTLSQEAINDAFLCKVDISKTKCILKVADLGFAKELNKNDFTQTVCGTPLNMAPEVLFSKKYDHSVDIWSTGVILFEMMTGFMPFNGMNKADLMNKIAAGNYGLPDTLELSNNCLDFINKCL